jgi:tellurite methyltransferase
MPTLAEQTRPEYDRMYGDSKYYWGLRPSRSAFEILQRLPPERPLKLLDIGCGEGRDAVFFARNGYDVTAFDLSEEGVRKTRELADRVGVELDVFQADVNEFRLAEQVDAIFSNGTLHCSDPNRRAEIFANFREFTAEDGLHVLNVFVAKPFIAPAPDRDPSSRLWRSGELLGHYADWRIEWSVEEIFDCISSGVPHQHCVNRIAARKPR